MGVVLVLLARSAGVVLTGRAHAERSWEPLPLDYLLALVSFLGMSAGSAMAVMGEHLFDRIETAASRRLAAQRASTEELAELFRHLLG